MNRLSIAAAALLALSTAAEAQDDPLTLRPEKTPSAVRHAGTYHVSTGTWTRTSGATASFGPDVIYSNTAPSTYFSSAGSTGGFASGGTNYDEGSIPGSQNPAHNANRDEYSVNCVQIGYCDTGAPGSSGWEVSFHNSYAPCQGIAPPDSTVLVTGLPAAGGCWTVDVDLAGGLELCIPAEGGDGFDGDVDRDSFGWSFRYAGTDGSTPAGFLLAGNPRFTDPNWLGAVPTDGTNTYYGPPSLCSPTQATGLHTLDMWFLEDPSTPANTGCYWFDGYAGNQGCNHPITPYASWHLELQGDTSPCDFFPTFCVSNPNSTGVNSQVVLGGSPSVSADDVTLTATLPPNSTGFFITSRNAGFTANPAGSAGNLCLGADIGRFQTLAANSGVNGTISISTTAGQWSVASIPNATGSYAAVPGTTSYFQLWHRDSSPQGPTSNFTDGTFINWLP